MKREFCLSVNSITPEAYCHLFDRLERDKFRYVVVGGIAVVLHGHVWLVVDLDLVVSAAPVESDRALQAFTQAGVRAQHSTPA